MNLIVTPYTNQKNNNLQLNLNWYILLTIITENNKE